MLSVTDEQLCLSKALYLQDNNDQEDTEVLILHLGGFLLGHHFCTKTPQHNLLENRITDTKYMNLLKDIKKLLISKWDSSPKPRSAP